MLNSFASDLDSILSDLSTSPPTQGSQEINGLVAADARPSSPSPADAASSHAASCPNLVLSLSPCKDPDGDDGRAPCSPSALPQPAKSSSEDITDSTEITLLERLIRSHPIWYLPNVQRIAAAQLLQNQEQGVNNDPVFS